MIWMYEQKTEKGISLFSSIKSIEPFRHIKVSPFAPGFILQLIFMTLMVYMASQQTACALLQMRGLLRNF